MCIEIVLWLYIVTGTMILITRLNGHNVAAPIISPLGVFPWGKDPRID
jgi:hypothetical protein